MRNSRELRTQQLGCTGRGLIFMVLGLIFMVLHLLSLIFLTGFLVVVAIQGSKDPRSHREKIYQELGQLKAGIDRLCRPCPWDWTLFQGNCYFFSKFQKNWTDSVTACKEAEAQLVVVESERGAGAPGFLYQRLKNFLQETSKKKGFTWMGLSDREEEGTWLWVDDSLLADGFTNYWLPGKPNNVGKEDCAEFRPEGWNDSLCKLDKFWICKKPAASCCYK